MNVYIVRCFSTLEGDEDEFIVGTYSSRISAEYVGDRYINDCANPDNYDTCIDVFVMDEYPVMRH